MLGNAQLYSVPSDSALQLRHALSAASQEKPADGQPDAAWKETIAKIYIGRGNTYSAAAYSRCAGRLSSGGEPRTRSEPGRLEHLRGADNTGDTAMGRRLPHGLDCRTCRADTWFVLASLLFAESSKTDPQGKFIIPDDAARRSINTWNWRPRPSCRQSKGHARYRVACD